jgi:hypothetical protein
MTAAAGAIGKAVSKIIGTALLGAVLAPLIAFVPSMAIYILDWRCGTPGDSGGCEMGIAVNLLAAIPVGAALGFLYGLWRVWRPRRKTPLGRN